MDKIKEVKELSNKLNLLLLIEVDGGIGKDNVKDVIGVGVNVIVVGLVVFNGGEISDNIKVLRG